MAEKKPSLYEILGVAPNATLEEIKAAHRRQSLEIMSGKLGLGRAECDHRLQVLDVALGTLSDANARDIYDRKQAEAARYATATPLALTAGPEAEHRALRVADAMAEVHRHQLTVGAPPKLDFGEVSQTLGATGRALKIILRVAILALVLLAVMRVGQNVLAKRQGAAPPPAAVVARAEEKLTIQEYFKRTGVRVASADEARALEAERRRAENEAREAQFNERRQREESERFFEESRRNAEDQEAEQRRAEAEARYEAQRRQREARAPRGEEQ